MRSLGVLSGADRERFDHHPFTCGLHTNKQSYHVSARVLQLASDLVCVHVEVFDYNRYHRVSSSVMM